MRYDVLAGPRTRSWLVDEIEAGDHRLARRLFAERRLSRGYPADARLVRADREDPGLPRARLRRTGMRARVARGHRRDRRQRRR